MKRLSITTIAIAIALAFGATAMAAEDTSKPATSKTESPGAYVDDAIITTKVKATIFEDASLKATEINVETYKGIVQLSGFVKSRADIDNAVKLAWGIKGVQSVKNDMIVKGTQ
ncbi:MAG: BON domain-containing protein [Betaproteobacteria bacterium]|nr:BON domain-containing protein [Betaproteobacteria bacterium]